MDRASIDVRPLREILARRYRSLDETQRLLDELGIDSSRIDMNGSAINRWFCVLQEAEHQDVLHRLAAVATTPVAPPEPEEILSRARAAQRRGEYGDAFSGSIAAATLLERRGLASHAVEALVDAVTALRPVRRGDLLARVLAWAARVCATGRVGVLARWSLLDRFALALYDHGRFTRAAEVMEASRHLRKRARVDAHDPQAIEDELTHSFRRRVQIETAAEKLGSRRVRQDIERLRACAEEFRARGMSAPFTSSMDVASKVALETLGDARLSYEIAAQTLRHADKLTHWWPLQELHWRSAVFLHRSGDAQAAAEHVIRALQLQARAPIVLEAGPGAPHLGGGHANLLHAIGPSEEALRERGVRVVLLGEVAFPWSRRDVRRAVRDIASS